MIDKEERFRKWLNLQIVKMKRVASVGSLILLALTNSFVIYPHIEEKGIHPYLGIPLVFFGLLFLIWLGAHVYVRMMEMYRTEFRAEMILNPYQVYAITPMFEMQFRHIFLPIMKSQIKQLDGKEKTELQKKIDMVEKWCKLGFIPKKDFPEHLKQYYITDKEVRL